MKKILRLVLCLGAALGALAGASRAESLTLSVDRATTLRFLRAATPYSIDVSKLGITETLTFYHPRELRFEDGHVRLRVDCRGAPIAFSAELAPTMSIRFDHLKNAFVAKVETMPVRIAGLGTILLDEYMEPIVIPVTFSSPLDIGVPGLSVATIVRGLSVLEDRIEAKVDLVFHKEETPARTSSAR
ncbi:MAG: hypothetical protein ACE5HU_04635 [Acidobacteriota bacterium]